MDQTRLQLSAASVPQHRRFVYRSAASDARLQNPRRRSTDVPPAAQPHFAQTNSQVVLLHFRVQVTEL